MPPPDTQQADFLYVENVPLLLRQRDQWMGTRFEKRSDGRLNKPPYSIRSGCKAALTNPSSWASFEEAKDALEARRFDAIGFVLSEPDELVGVDIDTCFTETGAAPKQWAVKYVQALPTYWEMSTSGTGMRAICEGRKPGSKCRRGKVEMYSQDKFLVMTGRHLGGTPTDVRRCQDGLDRLYRMVFGEEDATQSAVTVPPAPGSNLTDHEVPERIMRSRHGEKFGRLWAGDTTGYESHSNADLALCGMLAFWTGGDAAQIERLFTQSGLCRPKWTGRPDYRERTIRKALEGKTEFYSPPATLRRRGKKRIYATRGVAHE